VTKKELVIGIVLTVSFFGVLGLMFSPIWSGKTFVEYADDLFCSISKGSVYFIPEVGKEIEQVKGYKLVATIKVPDSDTAKKMALLYKNAEVETKIVGNEMTINGDLYKILKCALIDADALYKNRNEMIQNKYGYSGREILYYWWYSLKQIEKIFKNEGRFREAIIIEDVITKAIEPAYNYYGIKEENIRDVLGIVAGLLLFYVIYTVWWGFAIYYLFEGFGLKVTKAKEKREV